MLWEAPSSDIFFLKVLNMLMRNSNCYGYLRVSISIAVNTLFSFIQEATVSFKRIFVWWRETDRSPQVAVCAVPINLLRPMYHVKPWF